MKNKSLIYDFLWITISAILTAMAVNLIFSFTGLAPGGITGLCIIFSTITGISVDIMTLCLSLIHIYAFFTRKIHRYARDFFKDI